MRIGTRKSTMALAQTDDIARRLSMAAPELGVEIVKFETTGDSDQTSKLLVHGLGKLHGHQFRVRWQPSGL